MKQHYTEKKLKELLSQMTILIDEKEKSQHTLDYFNTNNIRTKVTALDFGQYSVCLHACVEKNIQRDMYFDTDVTVIRENSLNSLAVKFSYEREEFEANLNKQKRNTILIVENPNAYQDICTNNYSVKMNANAILGTLHSFNIRYNLSYFFTERKHSGAIIHRHLRYYLKNFLEDRI
ncbi:ERCC4 domain-containing protein [Candidatus Dependentiae bacterium]|nr:ERCC4 domain-containing protein [Candidatus Dependentiae bacterium]